MRGWGRILVGHGNANFFLEKAMELGTAIFDSQSVCCVNYPDQGIGLFEVVSPVGSEGFLATDVPLHESAPSMQFGGVGVRCTYIY